MANPGEPLPLNQAMNRPSAKLGLDLTASIAIVAVCVTVPPRSFSTRCDAGTTTLATGHS